MTANSDKPRLIDLFVFGKPKRRPFVTQDGTTIACDAARPVIVYGEPMPIWGEPIAMDARPALSGLPVTFDGAMPSPDDD